MQTLDLDPKTGDYIMVNGQPQETNHLTVAAYIRLKAPRQGLRRRDGTPGGWMYAPDSKWGSNFWAKRGTRISTQQTTEIEQVAAIALQPLADDGRASQIDLSIVASAIGALGLKAVITETNDQSQVTIPSLGL